MILISPAKRLTSKLSDRKLVSTEAFFKDDANLLARKLSKLSSLDLQKMMGISEDIADLNQQRFKNWDKPEAIEKRAIFQFEGDVFKNLDAKSLEDEDLEYMNENLRILSGIYGLLRPSDKMNPYRLEMGTKSLPGDFKSLYDFWGDRVATQLKNEAGENLIFNLASDEYFTVVKKFVDLDKIANFKFYTQKDGVEKVIGVIAKRVRGEMARFLIRNRIKTIEPIKAFDSMGFKFREVNGNEIIFVQKV